MFSTFVGLGRFISCQRPDLIEETGFKQGSYRRPEKCPVLTPAK